MGIRAQAERIGFQVIGELTRCVDREPIGATSMRQEMSLFSGGEF